MTSAVQPLPLERPRARVRAYAARLLGVALLASAAAYVSVSLYVAQEVTHAQRRPVPARPDTVAHPFEAVTFRSTDGLTLRGWFFSVAPHRAVVLVHGRDTTRLEGARTADLLLANGYSVLLFDLRGHGQSDGDRFSLGQHERKDVAGAVDYLGSRGFAEPRIALLGTSMGAGTALQALALRPNVGPVISDSSYSDAETLIGEVAYRYTGLPQWFNPGILFASRYVFGLDAAEVRPIDLVRAHPERAFLFMHCALDSTVPAHHARDLRAASANPASELWLAPNCAHVQESIVYPAEFEQRVMRFLAAQMP